MVIERRIIAIDAGAEGFWQRNKSEFFDPDSIRRSVGSCDKLIRKLRVAERSKRAEQNAHAEHAAVQVVVFHVNKF